MNFIEHIRELANTKPEHLALVITDAEGKTQESISRAMLLQKMEEAARGIASMGFKKGDRVALEGGLSADVLINSWAAWAMGVVTVPLDTKRDTAETRRYKIEHTNARELSTEKGSAAEVMWQNDTDHDALILFTSGTTGHPKGAVLTLNNVVVNARGITAWLHIEEQDRFLVQLPLHHINSTTFCLAALLSGATIVAPPGYSNSRFFTLAANTGATITSLVQSIIFDQLSRQEEYESAKGSLRLSRIQIGSAPVVPSAALEFIERYRIPLYQGYGQTETALRVTGVPMDLSPELYKQMVKENSIGTAMPWATVEVMDAQGAILGESAEGELAIQGAAVMRGYVGGGEAFRNGWFLSGDVGYWRMIENRKFFFLKGRKKELIIKGGVNISPVAVEDALKRIDAAIDQAYVVPTFDERYGEEVAACVVWKTGIDSAGVMRRLKLQLVLGTNLLSAYDSPQYLATLTADDLPMTSTGKVQRTVLRERFAGQMESIHRLLRSDAYSFEIITPHSPLAHASHELYNHCWQPLEKGEKEYTKYLSDYTTLGAIDKDKKLAGQISFSYKDGKISCVSICSANFTPKPVPEVTKILTPEEVREYLLAGHDPVMNFHTKLGAELVEVTPGGRPEDKSALGYTMLLKYPKTDAATLEGPVSHQLIAAVRILASDLGAEVYAISRPGGLAAHLAEQK